MSRKINFIGDSHSVLTFGQTVLAALHDVNALVHFLAYAGLKLQYVIQPTLQPEPLTISNFEKQPGKEAEYSIDPKKIGGSFDLNGADILILALGTNDIVECVQTGGDYQLGVGARIAQALKKITVKTIFFIEPPLLGVDVDLTIRRQLLRQMTDFGAHIISNSGCRADQADGIHMKQGLAKKMGEHVALELLEAVFPHH